MAATNLLLSAIAFGHDKSEPKPRICVVSDDAAVRVSLKFVFGANNFDVRGFVSGDEMLAWDSLGEAEGFVFDHKPRGADGLALARRLRARDQRAPIILTTGFRCGALETYAGSIEYLIVAPSIDEALIDRLGAIIQDRRRARLRKSP